MGNKSLFAIIAVLVCVCMSSTAFAESASRLTMRGSRLTAEEVESLEKQIEKDPDDITSRTILLGYYFRKQYTNKSAREAKQKHVLWLIMN